MFPNCKTSTFFGEVQLDGTSGFVEVAHSSALNLSGEWTIEAWVKQTGNDAQAPIVRKGSTTTAPAYYLYGNHFYFFYDETPYGGYYYDSSNSVAASTTTAPTTNEWHHLALVKSSSELKVFYNGVLEETVSATNDSMNNPESLFFGSRRSSTPSYFNGLIDEIRISSTAKYYSAFTPDKRLKNDADTIGLWHFEEGTSVVAGDSSGNGHFGTLNGGVTWKSDCVDTFTVPEPEFVDTVGSTEKSSSVFSSMKGNIYSVTTAKTITEIETYFSFSGSGTAYIDIYESDTLTGSYSNKATYSVVVSSGSASFYSTGTIEFDLEAGKYYYIGTRWSGNTTTYYFSDSTSPGYATSFGKWESGLNNHSYTGTKPSDINYSSYAVGGIAYYQRITSK